MMHYDAHSALTRANSFTLFNYREVKFSISINPESTSKLAYWMRLHCVCCWTNANFITKAVYECFLPILQSKNTTIRRQSLTHAKITLPKQLRPLDWTMCTRLTTTILRRHNFRHSNHWRFHSPGSSCCSCEEMGISVTWDRSSKAFSFSIPYLC